MKTKTLFLTALCAVSLCACQSSQKGTGGKDAGADNANLAISQVAKAEGDKAIYGLACMGCTDSVVVILPNTGGDPVRYNVLDAMRRGKVFGDIETGDWICVMPSKEKNRALCVVDLDKLKATWTYQVMPHLRDVTHLSKRQQQRILANMPDSIVETYMVPREYGFTLKRMSEASSVGRMMQASSVDDDSPVEYPEVPTYTEWHPYNCRLILVKGRQELNGVVFNEKTTRDTLDFLYMRGDSLALRTSTDSIMAFHRKKDAQSANAKASAAVAKQAAKLKQGLK